MSKEEKEKEQRREIQEGIRRAEVVRVVCAEHRVENIVGVYMMTQVVEKEMKRYEVEWEEGEREEREGVYEVQIGKGRGVRRGVEYWGEDKGKKGGRGEGVREGRGEGVREGVRVVKGQVTEEVYKLSEENGSGGAEMEWGRCVGAYGRERRREKKKGRKGGKEEIEAEAEAERAVREKGEGKVERREERHLMYGEWMTVKEAMEEDRGVEKRLGVKRKRGREEEKEYKLREYMAKHGVKWETVQKSRKREVVGRMGEAAMEGLVEKKRVNIREYGGERISDGEMYYGIKAKVRKQQYAEAVGMMREMGRREIEEGKEEYKREKRAEREGKKRRREEKEREKREKREEGKGKEKENDGEKKGGEKKGGEKERRQ